MMRMRTMRITRKRRMRTMGNKHIDKKTTTTQQSKIRRKLDATTTTKTATAVTTRMWDKDKDDER